MYCNFRRRIQMKTSHGLSWGQGRIGGGAGQGGGGRRGGYGGNPDI